MNSTVAGGLTASLIPDGMGSRIIKASSGGAPVNTVKPSIDNTSPNVGDLLTASHGTWVPPAGGYDYQWYWYDAGDPPSSIQISGATAPTYTAQQSDVGKTLAVLVTPYFSGIPSTSVFSLPTNAVVDPLAAFTWAARLQTHTPGSNTPLGLYQDVACTIPCTMDGDPVAAWRDELSASGIVATQIDPQKQPILVFDAGAPTVLFDGVDDYLQTTVGAISQPLNIFQNALPDAVNGSSFGSISGGANQIIIGPHGVTGGTVEQAYSGSSFISGSAWSGWHLGSYVFDGASFGGYRDGVLSFTGNPGSAGIINNILIGANEGFAIPFSGSLTSTLIPNPVLSAPDFATVNTYLLTLNP